MIQLLLILLGLVSNPDAGTTSNCGNDGTSAVSTQQNPGGTGGEEGHPVPPKIIGG